MRCVRPVVLVALCCLAIPKLSRAEAPTDAAWQKQITELEQRLFAPVLAADEVHRLLEELKTADTRAAAATTLSERGQAQVEPIIAFARTCLDIEAVQACADIVETLDANYRTSELGKRLGVLYLDHTEVLLPVYWARFRKDPLDQAAVAMLMCGDPEKIYAALGKSNDRYDRLRYLLLRIRELTPDRFAEDHVFEFTAAGATNVLSDVFTRSPAEAGAVGFHRAVGRTLLKYVEISAESGFGQDARLPRIGNVYWEGRRVFLFQVHGTRTAAHLRIMRHTYSPENIGRPQSTFIPDTTGPWYTSVAGMELSPLPGVKIDRDKVIYANYAWAKQFAPAKYERVGNFTSGWQGEPPEVVPAQAVEVGKLGSQPSESTPTVVPSPPIKLTPAERAEARKKAEIELAAAQKLKIPDDQHQRTSVLRARLAHAEAAMRLAPDWEEPARERIETLGLTVFYNQPQRNEAARQAVLESAEDYFRRFPDSTKHWGQIYDSVRIAVHVTFIDLHMGRPFELDPRRTKMLEAAERLADHAFSHGNRRVGQDYSELLPNIVYRGMRLRGVPIERREAWLDANLKRCAERVARAKQTGTFDDVEGVFEDHQLLQIRAAALAAEDRRPDRARTLLTDLQARVTGGELLYSSAPERMRPVWLMLDDATALAAFDRWAKNPETVEVNRMRVSWPAIQVWVEERHEGNMIHRLTPPVPTTSIRYKGDASITPLIEGDGRLYVLMGQGDKVVLADLPLDEQGKPVGQTHFVSQPVGTDVWDSLRPFPAQPGRSSQVQSARYIAGKLYLCTEKAGIQAFDPQSQKWDSYTSAQGLPGDTVHLIYPLDDHTLFCVDSSRSRDGLCYALDMHTRNVTLQQRLKNEWFDHAPIYLWRDGSKLMGWSGCGLVEDLLSARPKIATLPQRTAYGWAMRDYRTIRGVVEVGSRRFFAADDGLHEFDVSGKVVRDWYGDFCFPPAMIGERYTGPEIGVPPNSPALRYGSIVAAAGMIYFIKDHTILGFDPEKDTWYGPLAVNSAAGCDRGVATRGGLWLSGSFGLLFVDLAEFFERARQTGRVMTTEEFRRRRQLLIDAQLPLEQAKIYYSMRQFDKTRSIVEQVLKENPNHVEALLLSAYLYDRWCLNELDKAIGFYRRMAELKGNPAASLTGLLGWFEILAAREQWQAAYDLTDRILKEQPRMSRYSQRDLSYFRQWFLKKFRGAPTKEDPE